MQCPAHSLQSHSIGATIVGALDIFYMNAPLHVYICIFLEWESSVYVYACMHGAYVISCVWRFVTSWTVAHQVPLCMGFPRQEYWKGLPFPSPVICVCVCVCVCVDIFLHYDIEWTLSFKWLGSLNIGMFHLLLVFSYSFLSSWNNILQDKHLVNLTPKACVLWRRLYFPTLGRQAGGSLGAVSCACPVQGKQMRTLKDRFSPVVSSLGVVAVPACTRTCVCVSRSVVSNSLRPHEL